MNTIKYYLITDPISNLLWGAATTILIICGMFYLYRGYRNENFYEKMMLFGFTSFFFGFALARIFFYLGQFETPGTYINNEFYGNFDDAYPLYHIYKRIAYITAVIGLTFFILAFEFNFKETKFILTILNIVFIIFLIALPYELMKFLGYSIVFIDGLAIFILLFKLIKRSREEFQAILMVMLIGFTLFIMGHGFDSTFIKERDIVPIALPPILYILGSVIAIAPTILDPRFFSKTVLFWTFLTIFFISIASIIVYVMIIKVGYPLIFIIPIWIGGAIFIIFTFYSLYRTISNIKFPEKAEKIEDLQDFLRVFMRPPKITQEEISLYKDKKICLVCKSRVSKLMYLCPECDALYCVNCSRALSNLENACWVCDAPFDEAKPQKIEKTEEEIMIEAEKYIKRDKK